MLILGVIAVYFIAFGIVLHYRCDETEVRADFSGFHERLREATTKDVWIAAVWPVLLLYVLLKAFVFIINDVLAVLALLVGLKYKRTTIYKWINEKL